MGPEYVVAEKHATENFLKHCNYSYRRHFMAYRAPCKIWLRIAKPMDQYPICVSLTDNCNPTDPSLALDVKKLQAVHHYPLCTWTAVYKKILTYEAFHKQITAFSKEIKAVLVYSSNMYTLFYIQVFTDTYLQ